MDKTPTSQAFSTCPAHEMQVRPLLEPYDGIFKEGLQQKQFTLVDTEAKRFLAIVSAVKLLPVQQPPSVMDSHFVPDHWSVSSVSWTLHNL